MKMLSQIQSITKNGLFYSSGYTMSTKFEPNRRCPQANNRNILITAALPYVNNTPHLGNIIGAILSADTYARYCRMRGYNTLFVCGTDQYGTTTEVKAIQEKTSPKQICDKYHKIHKQIYDWFQIQFDHFGRTSEHVHTLITNQIFKHIYQNNGVQLKSSLQFYCNNCKISLADRYIVGQCGKCGAAAKGDQCDNCSTIFQDPIKQLSQPKCAVCKQTPVVQQSNHLYLKLNECSDKLKKWLIDEDAMKNWSNNARGVTKGWLNDGLQNRCITRNLNWGVPVPQRYIQGKKVFYVWFEAPIGYISITADALGDKWRKWWQKDENYKVQLTQFMGKDNIAFHSVIFPATLQYTNQAFIKPSRLCVTQYLLYEQGKFSKSNNIGVFGDDCQQTGISSDVWRFYLLLSRPETYDTQFQWQNLATVNKKDLMNNIGNMCNRILKYTNSNLGSQIPAVIKANYTQLQWKLINEITELIRKYCTHLQNVQIKAGANAILQIGQVLNKYMQDSQFWGKNNVASQRNKLIIGVIIRILQFYAILMKPYLPGTSQKIFSILSIPGEKVLSFSKQKQPYEVFKQHLQNPENYNSRWEQIKIQKPEVLFSEISDKKIKEMVKKFGSKKGNV